MTLNGKSRSFNGMRKRSRERRRQALASIGMLDAFPEQISEQFKPGEPINRVVIVPEPSTPEGGVVAGEALSTTTDGGCEVMSTPGVDNA